MAMSVASGSFGAFVGLKSVENPRILNRIWNCRFRSDLRKDRISGKDRNMEGMLMRSELLYWMEALEGPSCERVHHPHRALDPLPWQTE